MYFNTDVLCLTQSSHVTYAGVDPVSPGLFDVWVDKNVPPWAPLHHHDHHHLHLYYHDHEICITMTMRPPSPATSTCTLYYHHQHHYLFPYSQVKTFEITTSPAKHGNLAFCFRHCCLTCVHFRFHFSNRVLKSESTRERWHQPWYLQNQTIARTIMLLSMRPRFHDSRFYVNYVWQRALDTRKFPVSR